MDERPESWAHSVRIWDGSALTNADTVDCAPWSVPVKDPDPLTLCPTPGKAKAAFPAGSFVTAKPENVIVVGSIPVADQLVRNVTDRELVGVPVAPGDVGNWTRDEHVLVATGIVATIVPPDTVEMSDCDVRQSLR